MFAFEQDLFPGKFPVFFVGIITVYIIQSFIKVVMSFHFYTYYSRYTVVGTL